VSPDALLARAVAYQPPALAERRDLLLRWAALVERDRAALAQAITVATRKPIRLARSEVDRALLTLRGTAAVAARLEAQEIELGVGSGRAGVHRVALGPVLAVTPFNFPINLALHKLAPAVLAGCGTMLKPSPKAPGVAEALLARLAEAGAPADAVQLAAWTDAEVAGAVRDPRLALLTFTGSAAVGRHLQALGPRARVILELGGNAACILHQIDDAPAVAERVALGACAHAGQVCISVQRVFYPAARADWRQALIDAFARFPTGDPADDRVLCGPVIDAAAKARIQALLDRYRAQGARVLTGGTWDGLVLAPTLIEGLAADAPGVGDCEAFAPLATLHPYRDLDEALAGATSGPFGLQAGLFSRDEVAIARAFQRLEVGTLVVGDVPARRDDRLPYGGMKDSGCGREGTLETVLDYTQPKVLWRT